MVFKLGMRSENINLFARKITLRERGSWRHDHNIASHFHQQTRTNGIFGAKFLSFFYPYSYSILVMDEDEGYMYDEDEEEEEIGSSDFEEHFEMEDEDLSSHRDRREEDDFHYKVLTPDDIVQLMVDTIREVNAVVEVIWCKIEVKMLSAIFICDFCQKDGIVNENEVVFNMLIYKMNQKSADTTDYCFIFHWTALKSLFMRAWA